MFPLLYVVSFRFKGFVSSMILDFLLRKSWTRSGHLNICRTCEGIVQSVGKRCPGQSAKMRKV